MNVQKRKSGKAEKRKKLKIKSRTRGCLVRENQLDTNEAGAIVADRTNNNYLFYGGF